MKQEYNFINVKVFSVIVCCIFSIQSHCSWARYSAIFFSVGRCSLHSHSSVCYSTKWPHGAEKICWLTICSPIILAKPTTAKLPSQNAKLAEWISVLKWKSTQGAWVGDETTRKIAANEIFHLAVVCVALRISRVHAIVVQQPKSALNWSR